MSDKILYFIVPCYNEEEMFPLSVGVFADKLKALIEAGKISSQSRMLFVNDGSRDRTWELIKAACEDNPLLCGVSLSRNRGHQNALFAGLSVAAPRCDFTVTMDADLQDDIDAVDKMVALYNDEGCDVVYGVRDDRTTDSAFKRTTAQGFYKILARMGVETVYNAADFRLMSRRAVEALLDMQDAQLFLRGMVPLVGYKTGTVSYARRERAAGESKYPLKKMLALASDGIFGLSVRPLRMITAAGLWIAGLAFAALVALLILNLVGVLAAWWSLVAAGLFGLGGLILIALGIVGEYVGRTFEQTKKHPRFLLGEMKLQ